MTGYPDGPLDLRLELDAGGWTDATGDAWPDGNASVRVSSGRQANASTADPVTVGPALDNADGKYTPRLWSSPYYGLLRQNTPVRLSAAPPDGSSCLRLGASGDRALAADAAQLHIAGSLEARAELVLDDWQQTVIAAKADDGWFWELLGSGKLRFGWFDSSSAFHEADSTLPLPYLPGVFAVRVTLDASTGTVTFYTGDSIDGTFAQLGDPVSPTGGAATTVITTASQLLVGWSPSIDSSGGLKARVREFRLYNGIGGTLAADAGFSGLAAGTTAWTDGTGLAWSLAGNAEISGRDWVAHTELSGLTGEWHTSGGQVRAQVSSGGLLRRVQQGSAPPLDSAIRRAFLRRPAATYPRAYYTMEETGGQFGDATGGPAAVASGGTGVAYASDSSFACSLPLPVLNGAQVRGRVSPYPSSDTVVCRFLVRPGQLPSVVPPDGVPLMHVSLSGGPADALVAWIEPGYALRFAGWTAGTGFVFDSGPVAFENVLLGAHDVPLWLSMELHPDATAGLLNWGLWAMYPGAPTAYGTFGTVAGSSAGNAYAWIANDAGLLTDTALGHVTFQSAWESLFDLQQPLRAWQDEAAGQRIIRLCGEEGLPARVIGAPDLTVPMGPQAALPLRELLEETERTDGGILHDPAEALAVGYRTRRSMLNQQPAVLLDYSVSDLPGDISPADGDSVLVNDFTAVSASGSSARAVLDDGSPMSVSPPPPNGTGMGRYAGSDKFSPADDGLLRDIAQVRLRAGTVDESRITGIGINYGIPAFAGKTQAAGYVRPGDLIAADSPPAWLPPDRIRQIAVGMSAVLGPGRAVTYNCIPASPYDAWVWDDPEYGRLDSGASSLTAALAAPVIAARPGKDAAGWTAVHGTLGTSAAPAPSGVPDWALLTCDGTAFGSLRSPQGPVTAGQDYPASGLLYTAAARTLRTGITWYAGGAPLSDSVHTQAFPAGISPWAAGPFTAPATADSAAVLVQDAAPSAGEQLYATALTAWPAASASVPVSGDAWTQDSAAFPFDIRVAAEQMTVVSVGAGTSKTGAYLNEDNFEGDFSDVSGLWQAWSGKPVTVTRKYAGTDYSYSADLQEMVAAGTRILLSFNPAFNPVSAADLASITSLLATLKGAGADVIATVWHEPSNNGLTAAQFTAAVQYYAPAMRAYYPFWICLTAADTIESNGFYPGDDFTDGVAADQYYFPTINFADDSVTNAAAMADAHGKPFGVWEFNAAPGPNYLSGDSHTFAASRGNWTGLSNVSSFFRSGIVNPFGNGNLGGLGFNPTVAGDMAVQSAPAASFATQMQACSPGDEITVGTWVQAATVSRTCVVGAAFVTSAGVPVSTVYSTDASATNTDPVGGWSSAFGKLTAPAGAAFYSMAVKVEGAAVGETHRIGMPYCADSTSTGTTQANVTVFYQYVQSYMLARAAAGRQNGDVVLFNGGMPGSGNAVAVQHAADYRVGLWKAMRAALDGISGPQPFTLARCINGAAQAHDPGTPVHLWTRPAWALA